LAFLCYPIAFASCYFTVFMTLVCHGPHSLSWNTCLSFTVWEFDLEKHRVWRSELILWPGPDCRYWEASGAASARHPLLIISACAVQRTAEAVSRED
jgi:hypothetical protein